MAEIKIASILERVDYDLKRALEDAISNMSPQSNIDRDDFFREFIRSVNRKCSTWVTVNDHDVKVKCRKCKANE